MEFKIYNCSHLSCKPPYDIENLHEHLYEDSKFNYWNKETKWRYIGSVDSLEVARYMVEHNENYFKCENKEYFLKTEPNDEGYCDFVKIEYGHNVEYYDDYNNHTDGKIFERRFI